MPIYTNKGYNISYLSLTTVCHNYMFFTQKIVLIALVSIITQYKIDIYKLVKILFSPSLCFSFMHIYKYNNNMETTESKQDNIQKNEKKILFDVCQYKEQFLCFKWCMVTLL